VGLRKIRLRTKRRFIHSPRGRRQAGARGKRGRVYAKHIKRLCLNFSVTAELDTLTIQFLFVFCVDATPVLIQIKQRAMHARVVLQDLGKNLSMTSAHMHGETGVASIQNT
jgi:hypothetical protein